jgi:hypothetical protein
VSEDSLQTPYMLLTHSLHTPYKLRGLCKESLRSPWSVRGVCEECVRIGGGVSPLGWLSWMGL